MYVEKRERERNEREPKTGKVCARVLLNVLNTSPAVHEGRLPSRKGNTNMAHLERRKERGGGDR